MHIAHYLPCGGLPDRDPHTETPSLSERDPLDRDPLDRDPLDGTWDLRQRAPRRNMGPGSQTGSQIIQRPPCEQND